MGISSPELSVFYADRQQETCDATGGNLVQVLVTDILHEQQDQPGRHHQIGVLSTDFIFKIADWAIRCLYYCHEKFQPACIDKQLLFERNHTTNVIEVLI